MSCQGGSSGDINETFIIEPLSITGGSPTLSACTALYTNEIISCSGNTHILMGTDTISFSGNLYTDYNISANTINALTYLSGGTNLLDIFTADTYVTAFTYNNQNTFTIYDNVGSAFSVTFATVTGFTLDGSITPSTDGTVDLGGELTVTDVRYTGASTTGLTTPWTSTFTGQRFRSINTVSGGSTVWTSTYSVNTPNLDLGLDSSGNTRIITADSSVIQDDLLFGGTF
jgi:hypothetical protein